MRDEQTTEKAALREWKLPSRASVLMLLILILLMILV
jgi:hypothetical protein